MRHSVIMAVLGAWIAGTLILAAVATQNFRVIDRILAAPRPDFAQATSPLGHDQARVVLRHLSSELNRLYFRGWGWVQIALGGILLALLRGAKPQDRLATGGAVIVLLLALGMHLVINPQIIDLGRTLDFVPRVPEPPALARFWRLHFGYNALDGLKLILTTWLLLRCIRRAGPSVRLEKAE